MLDHKSCTYKFFCSAKGIGTHVLIRTWVDHLAEDGDRRISDEMVEVVLKGLHRIDVSASNSNDDRATLEFGKSVLRCRVDPHKGAPPPVRALTRKRWTTLDSTTRRNERPHEFRRHVGLSRREGVARPERRPDMAHHETDRRLIHTPGETQSRLSRPPLWILRIIRIYPLRKAISLIGNRFDKLEVIALGSRNARGHVQWLCQCECGRQKEITGRNLRSGGTRSCGCLREIVTAARSTTHGGASTTEYRVWEGLLAKIQKPRCKQYWISGGGAGVTISDRWLKFENFLEDMGQRPNSKMVLMRFDNAKGYGPLNCFWGTRAQLANSQRPKHTTTTAPSHRKD